MIKKYFLALVISSLLFSNSFAQDTSSSTKSVVTKSEEEHCFDLLSEYANSQYNVNLSDVEESEKTWERVDLSNYNSFKEKTVKNPNQIYLKSLWNFFKAKRNNIWTIRAKSDYILTQYTGFWNDSNFTFPLKFKRLPLAWAARSLYMRSNPAL